MILRVNNTYNPISNSNSSYYGTNNTNSLNTQKNKSPQNTSENSNNNENSVSQTDNSKDTSVSKNQLAKSSAESIQKAKIQEMVNKLLANQNRVIAHEAAHKAVGGSLAGAPSFQYTQGPDGKSYITGGEVPIDLSEGKTPQETISKMQQVIAAALAPADPSPQDYKVAATASQIQASARNQLLSETNERLKQYTASKEGKNTNAENNNDNSPKSQAITQYNNVQNATSFYSSRNLIGIG